MTLKSLNHPKKKMKKNKHKDESKPIESPAAIPMKKSKKEKKEKKRKRDEAEEGTEPADAVSVS